MSLKRTLLFSGAFVLVELLLLARVWARNGVIGLVAFIVASAFAGLFVLRMHGPRALSAWRAGAFSGDKTESAPWQAAVGTIAGALLLIPGVLSDMAGLLLLFPPVTALAAHGLRGRAPALLRAGSLVGGPENLWKRLFGRKDDPEKRDGSN